MIFEGTEKEIFEKILSIKEKESNDKLEKEGYIFLNEITKNINDELNNFIKKEN